jgi:hypothetical protein
LNESPSVPSRRAARCAGFLVPRPPTQWPTYSGNWRASRAAVGTRRKVLGMRNLRQSSRMLSYGIYRVIQTSKSARHIPKTICSSHTSHRRSASRHVGSSPWCAPKPLWPSPSMPLVATARVAFVETPSSYEPPHPFKASPMYSRDEVATPTAAVQGSSVLAMPGARKRILREGLRRGSRSGRIDPGHRTQFPDGGTVQISTFVSRVCQRSYPGIHRTAKPKARKREAAKKQ